MSKYISYLIEMLMYVLSSIFPHNKRIWITGKTTKWMSGKEAPSFFDNSKYFFLYLSKHTNEKVYWITSSKKEYNLLKKMNLDVIKYPSLKGFLVISRAKYCFHHYGINQISHFLQKGSTQINFWHGTPLKKIRYDVIGKPNYHSDFIKNIIEKNNVEYVASTSKYLSDTILCGAFDLSSDKFLNFGYPRTDILKLDKKDNYLFCQKYSPELIGYIDKCNNMNKVYLYMPTYRDNDPDYFQKANIDFNKLNKKLSQNNQLLFIKLHPLTNRSAFEGYSNIIFIDNNVDIYPFLIYVDTLITDYSSIYFDYLLLDREIIFIPYDYDDYINGRELYFDYEDVTPGKKYNTFDEFIEDMNSMHINDYSSERKKIRDRFISNYNFDACEKTFQYISKL